jgi:hypothetical protein
MPTKTKAAAAVAEPAELEAPLESMEESGDWDDTEYPAETEEATEEAPQEEEAAETSAPEPELPVRLAGQELLDFYNEKKAAGRTHSQIAYDAGYYTVTKSGQERVMQAQFNEAFLKAQGIETDDSPSGPGRSHAGLSKARVSGQGILLVSQLATRHVDAQPGDVYAVSYPGGGQILLTPTGEVKPVVKRKEKEEPGTPLLDQADPQEA